MYDLKAVANLDKIYKNRGLFSLNENKQHIQYKMSDEQSFHIILNTGLTSKVLKSLQFHTYDFFKVGLEHFAQKQDVEIVKAFFDANFLFKNGKSHSIDRKEYIRKLNEQINHLKLFAPTLKSHFKRRKQKYSTVLKFAETIVDFVFAYIVANVLKISFLSAFRILRQHQNIFLFYFHPIRHAKLAKSLENLKKISNVNLDNDSMQLALARNLVVMGRDPLVASICSSLINADKLLTSAVNRYFPVAETKRVCIEDVDIDGVSFKKGDIVSVNLLPAKDEEDFKPMGFGTGVHTCAGKRLAIWVLGLAEEILTQDEYANVVFDINAKAIQEGAFMLYEEIL